MDKNQGTSLDSNQGNSINRVDNKKYCLFCEKHVKKTYIPHLKNNIHCINFYFMKYDIRHDSFEMKMEKLKQKLKLSEQSRKRLSKEDKGKRER